MSTRTITTMRTSIITLESSSSVRSTLPQSSVTIPHLAACSAITLYGPAPSDATSQAPALPASVNPEQPQSSSESSSPTIPATAFWAVLAALILVLILLALALPLWYWLRGRHNKKSIPVSSSSPPPSTWPASSSPHSIQWSPLHFSTHSSQPHHLSPTQMQQLQILSQLQRPAPAAPSTDPKRRALLARLAALNNPSILGAIPEDSTILTTSSVYPSHNEKPVVNQHWADIKEKRLQEARERGEVCEMEVKGEEGVAGKEKKVRFREREWAVLASDGGGSRIEEVQHGDVESHLGMKKCGLV
ncbi:MAG: hypothetical protein Q9169_003928 [Polycauliona sp. 2 TL-2023]